MQVQSGGVLGGHGNGAPALPFPAPTFGVINASITVQSGGVLDPGDVSSGCISQTGVLTVNVPMFRTPPPSTFCQAAPSASNWQDSPPARPPAATTNWC